MPLGCETGSHLLTTFGLKDHGLDATTPTLELQAHQLQARFDCHTIPAGDVDEEVPVSWLRRSFLHR